MRLPVVAIVGRPNVGKSTLFNRIAGRRIGIVEDMPGVTRDRIYAEAVYSPDDGEDARFTLIDTGGFEPDPSTPLFAAVREQTRLAIDEADVAVLVVDVRVGVLPDDIDVARMLRKSGRPVIIAANKVDHQNHVELARLFFELGVPDVLPLSAAHGSGVSDLLEAAFAKIPAHLIEAGQAAERERQAESTQRDQDDDEARFDAALDEAELEVEQAAENDSDEPQAAPPRVMIPEVLRLAVVGRPNAGKSSFVNKLLGEDRHLVSDIPGTTVDAVDSFLEHGGHRFRLIDTAGIRRKRSIAHQVEKYAVVSALKGMDRCDVALFLLDATAGVTEQDLKVAAFAHDKGKAIIIVVNKWDLGRKAGMDADAYTKQIREQMPFLDYAPVRFVSALTGRRVHDVLETAVEVARQHFTRVPTAEVNRVVARAQAAHQPPQHKGRRVKLFFATQVAVAPPSFVIATTDPEGVHFSYRRFILNQIREAFGFTGAPLRLFFRRRNEKRPEVLGARDRRPHDRKGRPLTQRSHS
jgi:GTP-binding protein